MEHFKKMVKSNSDDWTLLSSNTHEIKTNVSKYCLGMPKDIALEKYTYSSIQSLLLAKELFSLNVGGQINYVILSKIE